MPMISTHELDSFRLQTQSVSDTVEKNSDFAFLPLSVELRFFVMFMNIQG
jgi:hypothetical protein